MFTVTTTGLLRQITSCTYTSIVAESTRNFQSELPLYALWGFLIYRWWSIALLLRKCPRIQRTVLFTAEIACITSRRRNFRGKLRKVARRSAHKIALGKSSKAIHWCAARKQISLLSFFKQKLPGSLVFLSLIGFARARSAWFKFRSLRVHFRLIARNNQWFPLMNFTIRIRYAIE